MSSRWLVAVQWWLCPFLLARKVPWHPLTGPVDMHWRLWYWQLEVGQIGGAEPDGMAAILKADVKYEVALCRHKMKPWTEIGRERKEGETVPKPPASGWLTTWPGKGRPSWQRRARSWHFILSGSDSDGMVCTLLPNRPVLQIGAAQCSYENPYLGGRREEGREWSDQKGLMLCVPRKIVGTTRRVIHAAERCESLTEWQLICPVPLWRSTDLLMAAGEISVNPWLSLEVAAQRTLTFGKEVVASRQCTC